MESLLLHCLHLLVLDLPVLLSWLWTCALRIFYFAFLPSLSYFHLLFWNLRGLPLSIPPTFLVTLTTFCWMWRLAQFGNDDALPNCLSSWIIPEYSCIHPSACPTNPFVPINWAFRIMLSQQNYHGDLTGHSESFWLSEEFFWNYCQFSLELSLAKVLYCIIIVILVIPVERSSWVVYTIDCSNREKLLLVWVIARVTVPFGINSTNNSIWNSTRQSLVLFQLLYECYWFLIAQITRAITH